jgi:hypothetical protein
MIPIGRHYGAVLAVVLESAVLLSACSGEDGTAAPGSIPVRIDLAAIMPTPEAVTALVPGVHLDEKQSGPQSRDSVIARYPDATAQAANLDRWGWLAEESAVYMGPALVAVTASQYSAAEGAHQALADWERTSRSDATAAVSSAAARSLGEESFALHTADAHPQGGLAALIVFREGNVVVRVGVAASKLAPAGDPEHLLSVAETLAEQLADRLQHPLKAGTK